MNSVQADRVSDLLEVQLQSKRGLLISLVTQCAERYVQAARLLEFENERVAAVRELRHRIFTGLWLEEPFHIICERYREELYDAQTHLVVPFDEHMKKEWFDFIYLSLFPRLLEDDTFVRHTLMCVEALPVKDLAEVSKSLGATLREMSFSRPSRIAS